MAPRDAIRDGWKNGIRRGMRSDLAGHHLRIVCFHSRFAEQLRFAPEFQTGLKVSAFFQMRFDMKDWMICVDPDAGGIFTALQFNAAIFQLEHLRKIGGADKWISIPFNPHPAKLHQLARFRPCIGLGHE